MEDNTLSAKNRQNQFFLLAKQIRALITMGTTNMATWMVKNRATYPGFLFRAGTIAVGIVLAAIAMHMVGTGYGVITEDVVMQAGVSILLIIFLSACLIMARAIYLSFFHVVGTWNENRPDTEPKLLAAPTWTPPDISPDILVCAFDERAVFEKAERAGNETTYAIWAVIIPPFKKNAAILTAEKETDYFFDRGSEPFAGMVPPELTLPSDLDHIHEDEAAYRRYVEWFCITYRQWRDGAKLEANKGRARKTIFEVMEAHAKAVSAALCFMLFCLPAFGQQSKTRQVDEALGTRIREIPAAGAKITYAFQEGGKEKYYTRTGDGISDYTELLQRPRGIVQYNDHGGELIAVTKNGEIIARGPYVERVNITPPAGYIPPGETDDPIRPRNRSSESHRNGYLSLPDSATTASTLNGVRHEWDDKRGQIWQTVKPTWEWIMSMFFSIVPLFICFGGMFRYYAGTAANEAFYGLSWIGVFIRRVHETASGITLLLCWCIATVLLIDEFMLFVYMNIPLWVMLLTWFPSLWLAKVLTNWAVPDPPAMIGNRIGIENPYSGQRRIG